MKLMKMMNPGLSRSLIFLVVLCALPQAFGATEPLPCAEKSVVAGAVRTLEDVQSFVQCAYEFVQEVGFEEARRAFHEDERWFSGETYLFVDQLAPSGDDSLSLVFPPDPSIVGTLWGAFPSFGSDFSAELYRIATGFGSGWIYYESGNHVTGLQGRKISYIMRIDWDGYDAAIGAGIYPRDIPGTCRSDQVNAMQLEAAPSAQRLQAFVRCAAMELEARGYFATGALSSDPRWRSGSIYLFGLDRYGNALFTGDPYSHPFGGGLSELGPDLTGTFGGRDVAGVADAFGETFLYYSTRNPATGQQQRKVTFVKRVTAFGVPILLAAGFYAEDLQ